MSVNVALDMEADRLTLGLSQSLGLRTKTMANYFKKCCQKKYMDLFMQLPGVKTDMKAKQLNFFLLPDVLHKYVYNEYFIYLYSEICVKCYIPPITNIIWCEGMMEVKMMLLKRKKKSK